MKIILSFILSAFVFSAYAQNQIITASVTVTNVAGTTSANTIAVNGSTRNFTNYIQSYQNNILASNSISAAASNLFLAYAIFPQNGVLLSRVSTNQVNFQSYPALGLTVTISSGWGTVSWSTNYITNSIVVRVPVSSVGLYDLTNIANGLRDYLNSGSVTNAFSSTAPAFANFAQLSTIISYSQANTNFTLATSNSLRNFTLSNGANGTNNDIVVSNGLIGVLTDYNIQNITPYPDGPAFKAGDFFQPSNNVLTSLVANYPAGIPANLSYYGSVPVVGGYGNDIVLNQTNVFGGMSFPNQGPNYDPFAGTGGDSITRLTAFYDQAFNEMYEDGRTFLQADTTHNVQIIDHNFVNRLQIYDGGGGTPTGGNVLRGADGQDGIVQTKDGMLYTQDPVVFNTAHWPATTMGTATNMPTGAQNLGTGDTTINSFDVPALLLTNLGDSCIRSIGVTYAAHSATKRVQVYYAGTQIIDTGDIANSGSGSASLNCELTVVDNSSLSSETVAYNCTATAVGTTATPVAKVGTKTGVNMNSPQTFYVVLTAGTGGATGDIVVISDNTRLAPSAAWQGVQ